MSSVSGRVHSIETFGALDGPGIRYVVFFQGCPMRCAYCHNPDSWSSAGGTLRNAADILSDIRRYLPFLKNGGVTLSGGEPLLQPAFAAALLRGCRDIPLHTALDTAGGVALSRCQPAVELADLLLLDIKAAKPALFQKITGRPIGPTLALLDFCQQQGKPVWVRHVLVPGLTASEEALTALGRLIASYTCVQRIELLPFHKMGEYKWQSLHTPYTLTDTPPADPALVAQARQLLLPYHPDVRGF